MTNSAAVPLAAVLSLGEPTFSHETGLFEISDATVELLPRRGHVEAGEGAAVVERE